MRGPNQTDAAGVVRIARSGTTAIMVIPKPFLRLLQWSIGDHVTVHVESGRLWVGNLQPHVVALTTPRTEGVDRG